MTELTAEATVRLADHTIHDVGSTWMMHADVMAAARRHGYPDPIAFYFAGRGGVLGDVDASVIVAAMGWWEPGMVRANWERGLAVAPAAVGAQRYAAVAARWGAEHLAGLHGGERLAQLAAWVVDAAEGSGLPLFSGWRAMPRADSWPGRLAQLIHLLRELRGGLHLVGTTAVGLRPREAILTNEGERQAGFFGWGGDFPDVTPLRHLHDEAEAITDRLAAAVYECALTPAERGEFVDLVGELGALVLVSS